MLPGGARVGSPSRTHFVFDSMRTELQGPVRPCASQSLVGGQLSMRIRCSTEKNYSKCTLREAGEPGLLATNGTGVKNLEMGLPSADKGYLALTAHSEMRLIKKESVVQRSLAHPILLRNRVQRQASDTSYRRVDNHGRVLNLPPFCRYLSRVLQDMPGEKQISAESCPACKHALTQQHCYHSALCSGK